MDEPKEKVPKKDSERIADSLDAYSNIFEGFKKGTIKDDDFKALQFTTPFIQIIYLGKIAFNLAKLVEHIELVDESVFGGQREGKEKKVQETGDRS